MNNKLINEINEVLEFDITKIDKSKRTYGTRNRFHKTCSNYRYY